MKHKKPTRWNKKIKKLLKIFTFVCVCVWWEIEFFGFFLIVYLFVMSQDRGRQTKNRPVIPISLRPGAGSVFQNGILNLKILRPGKFWK